MSLSSRATWPPTSTTVTSSRYFSPATEEANGMNCDLFDLNGENAVVIGGTGVLGGAMAGALAAAGARVAVLGRNRERGEERVRGIESQGGEAAFHIAD